MRIRPEEIRLRYRYRRLILSGKARISLDASRALVGPDCAYHLYGHIRPSGKTGSAAKSERAAAERRRGP